MDIRNRGMMGNVGQTLITLLVIGVLAYVCISIFNSMSTSLTTGITGQGLAASNNFTAGIWSAIGLLSNVPYLIGALALLGVVVLFGYYAGGGKIA
jgi:hypothetical protein